MNQYLIVLLFVVLLPLNAVCQVSNEDLKTMLIVRDLERESRPSRGAITGPGVVGDPYYSKRWNPGTITIYRDNKTFKLPGIKYDMVNFGVDALLDNQIKSLDGNLVKSFEYADSISRLPHRFVNGKDFTRDGVPVLGFLEILCWGKVDVYAFTETTILKPNYNTALSSGSQDYQISKKRTLVYSPGIALRPMNKKELVTLWKEKESEMNSFQKINKLSLSNERDLLLMVDYFNTLSRFEK